MKMEKRFYVGSPQVVDSDVIFATEAEAVAYAARRMSRTNVEVAYIVQIVKVVRPMPPPVDVEDVEGVEGLG